MHVLRTGEWDPDVCTLAKLEEIKDWLLDDDACPTNWRTLLDIREAHA